MRIWLKFFAKHGLPLKRYIPTYEKWMIPADKVPNPPSPNPMTQPMNCLYMIGEFKNV